MHQIQCSEIWGGINDLEEEFASAGITASLFSRAANGGKGGDIYYASVCGSDMLTRIALCDVVGHGAAVSQMSAGLFDSLKRHMNDDQGSTILDEMNTVAVDRGLKALTTAAVIGYYTKTGELSFSYAGHPPAWVWQRSKGIWERADVACSRSGPANIPLGVFDQTHFHQTSMALSAGDKLVVYSDGIIEAPDHSGHLFGEDGVLAVLSNAATDATILEVRQALTEAAKDHAGGHLAHDDVTILAVEVN